MLLLSAKVSCSTVLCLKELSTIASELKTKFTLRVKLTLETVIVCSPVVKATGSAVNQLPEVVVFLT